jgi:quercetin dioxygenase-like cupin family protein
MKLKLMLALTAVAVCAAVYGGSVLARTAATGFVGSTIAHATYGPLDLRVHSVVPADAKAGTIPARVWEAALKTKGDTDAYVQSNTWQPGGSTGWHTHPGWSLIFVTSGAVTAYEGDDPSCTPHVYTAGQSFVDEGGGHVHLIRNETDAVATGVAVQLIPAGATRTQPAAAPGNCPF